MTKQIVVVKNEVFVSLFLVCEGRLQKVFTPMAFYGAPVNLAITRVE